MSCLRPRLENADVGQRKPLFDERTCFCRRQRMGVDAAVLGVVLMRAMPGPEHRDVNVQARASGARIDLHRQDSAGEGGT